ncbi:MAG: 1-deoxy-D-xylulose-5-phosphate synthase [Lentisphaeria bacterium]|nr:1-deoxy-D-xylulose-5-phosphate synthase [Lentisphaeria bacterium]
MDLGQYKILDRIDSPADLKKMSLPELQTLCQEIRHLLVDVVSVNGGHLAPNLGIVELTVALHYVFDCPNDKMVWDVSHQSYVHKLLTGRRKIFSTLRQYGGCCGFTSRKESEYDIFGSGHAGNAISAVIGLSVAAKMFRRKEYDIAILGDGALGCGISLEALNSVKDSGGAPIIILNDNKMSIAENVGAMSFNLTRMISGRFYNQLRHLAKLIIRHLPWGNSIYNFADNLEAGVKGILLPTGLFEKFGLRYVGPINGHSLEELIFTFNAIKSFNIPTLVHVITEKGHGYAPAAEHPEKFHGIGPFDANTGAEKNPREMSYSKAFGLSMCELAGSEPDLLAITAAMASGTGLSGFAKKFPKRFFDVGIAEEHAVVFAAGLAAGGKHPVVAIYATFFQRALDCVFHDVCLQNLPVIFALDRAGMVADGPTHHGVLDNGFLQSLPNLTIMEPSSENELRNMLYTASKMSSPVVIRYPRGASGEKFNIESAPTLLPVGHSEILKTGTDGVIWALGQEVVNAIKLAEILKREENIDLTVVDVRFLKPLDKDLLHRHFSEYKYIFTLENHVARGGLAMAVDIEFTQFSMNKTSSELPIITNFGLKEEIIPHGAVKSLREFAGIDLATLHKKIATLIEA